MKRLEVKQFINKLVASRAFSTSRQTQNLLTQSSYFHDLNKKKYKENYGY